MFSSEVFQINKTDCGPFLPYLFEGPLTDSCMHSHGLLLKEVKLHFHVLT